MVLGFVAMGIVNGCIVCALLMGVLICGASAWAHRKRAAQRQQA